MAAGQRRIGGCVLAVIVVLLGSPPAAARHRNLAAEPGDFDYYLLSLSIAPSFCALSAGNAAKDECRSLTGSAFRETPLTVHGLWPNRANVSVNRQPHDCDGPPFERLPAALQAELARYMPAGPGLAHYEWRKHGTCSGLSPETYFADIARLARQANATIGAAMREQGMLENKVRIADLLKAVAARDPALAQAIVVDCRSPRGGGAPLVDEIRVTLSRDLAPIPAQSVGLGQNSGCPRGVGRLPAPSQYLPAHSQ